MSMSSSAIRMRQFTDNNILTVRSIYGDLNKPRSEVELKDNCGLVEFSREDLVAMIESLDNFIEETN